MSTLLRQEYLSRSYPLMVVLVSVLMALTVAQFSAGIAAGLVLGSILAVLGLVHYEVLVHGLIVLLPLQSSLPYSYQALQTFNLFNALAAAMFGTWFVNAMLQRRRLLHGSVMNLALLLFCLLCLAALLQTASVAGSAYMTEQLNPLKRWLSPMLLFFPIANAGFSRPAIKRLVTSVVLMTMVVTLWTLKDLVTLGWGNISEENRIGGPFGFGGENDLAAFFVYYPVLVLTLGLHQRQPERRLFLLGLFGLAMICLLLLLSRGAYLGMLVVLAFVALVRYRWMIPPLVLAVAFYQFWAPGAVQERMESTRLQTANESVGGRVPAPYESERHLETSSALRWRIWRGAVRIIESHPVTGIGYNTFSMAIPAYANIERNMDAHNMFLRVGAEMGVFGLLGFLLLLFVPFATMLRVYRTTADRFLRGWMLGGMASIPGIMVVNFFGSRFVREELVGLHWVLVALTYAYVYLRRRRLAQRAAAHAPVFMPVTVAVRGGHAPAS
ncbi:MAG: O-antigen ligase family protein [candidate division KSB1 bacterium]|nr:O-antigen ligase family protein [candidate division KSB1 bacterium]MDZ7273638.1 O-antigen ligase family protein [candidate division KSB1 bacterium]MDZ7286771.1 O-antigen ligase family protein [candidate division KSB1 bacterium]MDZ7299872.1 O-antigen ligase family protein [candidate division KSB1 bacterium]MDZ7305809.1 O-antigen ligase family protein [candidate division KSB1 bacterium]